MELRSLWIEKLPSPKWKQTYLDLSLKIPAPGPKDRRPDKMEPEPVKVQAIPFKEPIKSVQHKLPNKRKLKDNRQLSNTKPKRECLNQEAQVPSKQCLEKVFVSFLVIINSYSYLLYALKSSLILLNLVKISNFGIWAASMVFWFIDYISLCKIIWLKYLFG